MGGALRVLPRCSKGPSRWELRGRPGGNGRPQHRDLPRDGGCSRRRDDPRARGCKGNSKGLRKQENGPPGTKRRRCLYQRQGDCDLGTQLLTQTGRRRGGGAEKGTAAAAGGRGASGATCVLGEQAGEKGHGGRREDTRVLEARPGRASSNPGGSSPHKGRADTGARALSRGRAGRSEQEAVGGQTQRGGEGPRDHGHRWVCWPHSARQFGY